MIELLSNDEMARADALAIEQGAASLDLMERAGCGLAESMLRHYGEAHHICVLCGPGNNGGDGFVAARKLQENGLQITVALLGRVKDLTGDAALMAQAWSGSIEALELSRIEGADLYIDALFGAGLSRPVSPQLADIIDFVNESGRPIVAADIPTGIDGSTGACLGKAIWAALTVTFFRQKPGHLLLPGRDHCGTVELIDIGISKSVISQIPVATFANVPQLWNTHFPSLTSRAHKYLRGHALVFSGPAWSTGAARLAARGALRAGTGLVTVASPKEALQINAAQLTAIMLQPFESGADIRKILSDSRKNAVLIGPAFGVGGFTRECVLTILQSGTSTVLDADALSSFEQNPEILFRTIQERAAATVLTPHEGEFSRLFARISPENSKLSRARQAARQSGAVIILKGADSVIAAPDGRAAVSANALPFLATAGSGDVLAGILTGMLAQKMPTFEAACSATWLHGEAGNVFGQGLIAEDIPEMLPTILTRLHHDWL